MTAIFDTYIAGKSLLHRLDPRTKFWAALLGLSLTFLLPNLLYQVLFAAAIHVVLLSVKIPAETLGRVWRRMAVVLALIIVLQPFFSPSGIQLLRIGPLRLTSGGIVSAMTLALRAVNVAFVACALLFTTTQPALVQGLVRLGLPYSWGLTISLSLRFLPAIEDLFHRVRDAQAARGWVAEGSLLRRARDHIPILVAVLISTLRMSDQLTLALAARGIDGDQPRSTWRDLCMTRTDWAVLIGATAIFALIVFQTRMWG